MRGVIRSTGFSLLTKAVGCAVGTHSQPLDARMGQIASEGELPADASIDPPYAELDFQQATRKAGSLTITTC